MIRKRRERKLLGPDLAAPPRMDKQHVFRQSLLVASLGLSCGLGTVPDPDHGAYSLGHVRLVADELGALRELDCAARRGFEGCAAYPNPLECDHLDVNISRDGRTDGLCQIGAEIYRAESPLDGLPLACAREATPSPCVRCADLYGRIVFDSCEAEGRQIATDGFSQLVGSAVGHTHVATVQQLVAAPQDLQPPADDKPTPQSPSPGSGRTDPPPQDQRKQSENNTPSSSKQPVIGPPQGRRDKPKKDPKAPRRTNQPAQSARARTEPSTTDTRTEPSQTQFGTSPFSCRYPRWSPDGPVYAPCTQSQSAGVADDSAAVAATDSSSSGGGSVASGRAPRSQRRSACIQAARSAFTSELNRLLAAEGLQFSFVITSEMPDPGVGGGTPIGWLRSTFSCGGFVGGRVDCDPAARKEGRCFCADQSKMIATQTAPAAVCRCGRFLAQAARRGCSQKPADCPAEDYKLALLQAYQAASLWLNANGGGGRGRLLASRTIEAATSPASIACLNSPLVLDLNGDGLRLSSAQHGVHFDLTGHGAMKTAWVLGRDDALLAIDRNGNGRIDHGGELFGQAPSLAGTLEADGFAALRWLDSADFGGNGNGVIDRGDRMFAKLLLWRDVNADGRSTADELTPLMSTDIAILSTRSRSVDSRFDEHGNDIGRRSYFLRDGGRPGSLTDVFFIAR